MKQKGKWDENSRRLTLTGGPEPPVSIATDHLAEKVFLFSLLILLKSSQNFSFSLIQVPQGFFCFANVKIKNFHKISKKSETGVPLLNQRLWKHPPFISSMHSFAHFSLFIHSFILSHFYSFTHKLINSLTISSFLNFILIHSFSHTIAFIVHSFTHINSFI